MSSNQKSRAHFPFHRFVPVLIAAVGGMTIACYLIALPMQPSSEIQPFAESAPSRVSRVRVARRLRAPSPIPVRRTMAKTKIPAGVKIYLASARRQTYSLFGGVNLLTEQFQSLNSDPARIADRSWIQRSAAGCERMASASGGLQHLSPIPSECQALNRELQCLGAAADQFALAFGRGVDAADGSSLREVVGGTDSLHQQGMQVFSAMNGLQARYQADDDEAAADLAGENTVAEASRE